MVNLRGWEGQGEWGGTGMDRGEGERQGWRRKEREGKIGYQEEHGGKKVAGMEEGKEGRKI